MSQEEINERYEALLGPNLVEYQDFINEPKGGLKTRGRKKIVHAVQEANFLAKNKDNSKFKNKANGETANKCRMADKKRTEVAAKSLKDQ